ncbi:LysR family transcriptional regulator [Massilia dura]|uniref:LysR family transcriptional regulator n=1 Tax=Pseudoduganella dura TaxID=321982 RepID=A0A6I3XLL5_9BURK|nr:LysR substrate-binding domain-containing protein [Pseudoduganella dura]MUI15420.1 LysR family transcriptional regulator [Pseudoduganella dura]GGX80035.1 transcriptional regulator [Pseudoduganella dura]
MNLDQLEAFVHVAELSSFTRASAILGRTQPALSRLVRQLEVELRQNLLLRNGRGVVLTEAGKVLLEHSKGILHQVEGARDALKNLQGSLDGQFKIGLAPSVARFATLALVRSFQAQFPQATIAVSEGLSSYLVEWLAMGRIDAAILYDTGETPLIDKRTLFTEEIYLISRANADMPDTISMAELARYPLIIPGRQHAIRTLVEMCASERRVQLDIALEIDAVPPLLDLVDEGHGHAALPLNAILADARQRRFRCTRIVDPVIRGRMALATNNQHPMSRLATRAVAMLESEIMPLYEARQKNIDAYLG